MTDIELPRPESLRSSSLSQSKKHSSSGLQWFYNLPLKSKQLTGLFTSELISVLGLVGVGAVLIVASGRSQLVRQAEAELAVTATNYNLKIDQLGVGFRSQADNPAIIAAAKLHTQGQSLTPDLRTQVKQILHNELKADTIEYATLVGKDLRIIANANTDRTGETFNPNNLVSEVFKNPKQIEASQIVSWADLEKESPPLPKGLTKQDALIRYTVTPVKDSATGSVIGALVAGDIVNGKLPIVENTLKAFSGGYSAVYYRQPSGKFALATALNQSDDSKSESAKPVALIDTSLLDKAVASPGKIATDRAVAGTQSYTMAAKALTDFSGKPVAVLVRGTQENALNKLLGESLLVQLAISGLTLAIDVILAILLGRTIAQPIKRLQRTARIFASGDRTVRAEIVSNDEVGQLAETFNDLAQSIVKSEGILAEQARHQLAEADRLRLYAKFTSSVYKSLRSEDILRNSAEGVRIVAQTDRVVIYRLDADYQSGTIVAESVASGWSPTLGQTIPDMLAPEDIENYKNGHVWICNDIDEADLWASQRQVLEQLQVKAYMVAPILQDGNIVALLWAHQCSSPREWQPNEIDLFRQLSAQISFALNQAHLFDQLERSRQDAESARREAELVSEHVEQARLRAEIISEEQRQQKEELQHQVLDLLNDIEHSAKGDLTVRANVTESTIGTVADFFNSIIESLRQIVTQVKQASAQVNTSLLNDEQAVKQLSNAALNQAEEITRTLDSIEQMTYSIQEVAQNANQAAKVARTAALAAEAGGIAIDNTVENIVKLQKTVVKTTDKVKILGESSQEIAKVVSIVQGIALQTNLLAINAGIEASRAGEEGQGFRVVAEQIGQLATQVADATREIEQVIETIQAGTKEVIEVMQDSRSQVNNGTTMVIDAKQNLQKIFEVSHQIDQIVRSISNATVSQAQTSQILKELMQDVAETSQQTSDSSRKVSKSLRETVAVAEQLQTSVGRFKIADEPRLNLITKG
jgi:twitching motility protein PilJ